MSQEPPQQTTDSDQPVPFSDQLEGWLTGEGEKTLGSLVHTFGDKSFAILLVVLLAIPALPLPTGGISHLFLLIGGLIALEMIAGRKAGVAAAAVASAAARRRPRGSSSSAR